LREKEKIKAHVPCTCTFERTFEEKEKNEVKENFEITFKEKKE